MPRRKKTHKMFRDPWNPSHEEVMQWAYMPNVYAPTQDFELAVSGSEFHDLILQCAADESCPNRCFFLSCLYVLVGDAVRTKWNAFSETTIITIVRKGKESSAIDVRNWAKRAGKLIADPTLYNYDQWGLGSSFVYGKQ